MKHRTKHLIHDFVYISMHYRLHVSHCVYNLVISLFVSVHCSTNNCTNIVVSCTFCLINKQQKYIHHPPPILLQLHLILRLSTKKLQLTTMRFGYAVIVWASAMIGYPVCVI